MKKIKSLGVIALVGLSFVFMSFSSASQDMYGDFYLVTEQNTDMASDQVAAAGLLRLTIRATRKAIAYTKEVVRVAAPGIDEVLMLASTYAVANNVDKHSKDYVNHLTTLKAQKVRELG